MENVTGIAIFSSQLKHLKINHDFSFIRSQADNILPFYNWLELTPPTRGQHSLIVNDREKSILTKSTSPKANSSSLDASILSAYTFWKTLNKFCKMEIYSYNSYLLLARGFFFNKLRGLPVRASFSESVPKTCIEASEKSILSNSNKMFHEHGDQELSHMLSEISLRDHPTICESCLISIKELSSTSKAGSIA